MINESTIIDLMTRKIVQPLQDKCNGIQETLIPYANVYEMLGRRGFHKEETRLLGHFFESKGFVVVAKHGWLVKPPEILQNSKPQN